MLVYCNVPPDAAVYQRNVPGTVDTAPRVTDPSPHLLASIPVTEVPTTVAVTFTRGLAQLPFEYST